MKLTGVRPPLDAIPDAATSDDVQRVIDSARDVIATADALEMVADAGLTPSDRLAATGSAAGAASSLLGRGMFVLGRRLVRGMAARPAVTVALIVGVVVAVLSVRRLRDGGPDGEASHSAAKLDAPRGEA